MTRLEQIQQSSLTQKAATMLNKKPSQIVSVTEHENGARVECRNGNYLIIPLRTWIGTEFE